MKIIRKNFVFMVYILCMAMLVSLLPANMLQVSATDESEIETQYPEFEHNRITVEAEDCEYDSSVYVKINNDYFSETYTGTKVTLKGQYDTAKEVLADVSGGAALHCADSKNNHAGSLVVADQTPALTYTFNAPEAGTYYVWVRAWSTSGDGCYLWIALDEEKSYTQAALKKAGNDTTETYNKYVWYKVKTNVLEAGEHIIKIHPRKQYGLLDKLLISDSDSLIPTGDGEVRASVGGNYYSTLQEAIGAATKDDTITLLDDVAATADVTVTDGVTLDLNGYTLDMGDSYLYSEGDVVDSSTDKSGRLKIATYAESEVAEGQESLIGTPKGKLAEDNGQMPVYISGESAYMLASMTAQWLTPTIDTDYFTSVSRPSFGDPHYEKLQGGASAAKLQFILRLDWSTVTGGVTNKYYQEFSYSDALVRNVYTNGKAFSVTVNGLADYALKNNVSEYVVSEYVKSDLGVVLKNNSFSMNTTSGQ